MTDIIDFHAHILPRADHGSSSVDTSLCQISFARQSGVDCIVATPHFYPAEQAVEAFLERRESAYMRLKNAIPSDAPRIVQGAEVLICDSIEKLPRIKDLCVEGTNVLLLELPFTDFDMRYKASVHELIRQGIAVVIAHADRYDKRNIELLISEGAKIQLNANSLTGLFVKKHLYGWIDAGFVVALGSDIHNINKKAYKGFSAAMKRIGGARVEKIMSAAKSLLKEPANA
jgi:protein-tyrosine phosphatase